MPLSARHSENSLLAILKSGDLSGLGISLCVFGKGRKRSQMTRVGGRWLGLSQSLPEGGGDDEDDEQTEMRSMVGFRGGAQCRLGTHVNLPRWCAAMETCPILRRRGWAGTVRPRYRHKWRDGAWLGRYWDGSTPCFGCEIN